MRFHVFLYLVVLFQWSGELFGQQLSPKREVNEQVQFWTSINSTTRLSNRWGFVADAHIRRNHFIKNSNFYFARTGAVFWLDDQFSLVAGIAGLWLATPTDVGIKYSLERRIYQQALWRAPIQKMTFLQRIRVEQRWRDVINVETGEVDRIRFTTRFRFLLSATIKTFENPKLPKPMVSNEILFHLGEEVVYNTFEQNRLFVGVNQKIAKNWSFDLGYMLVYQQKFSGYQYDLNHTFRWFFYYFPDLRKDKDKGLDHYPVGTPN